MMTPREVVKRTVTFSGPDRLAMALPEEYGSDISGMGMTPSPDSRPSGASGESVDEWGAVWHNIGVCRLGEVKRPALPSWDEYSDLRIPDIREPRRWERLSAQRQRAGNRFVMASGISLYERAHFIRGLENVWMDLYTEPDRLRSLIQVLVDMNLEAIPRYAAAGADGFMWCDDWGLQDRLMIAPDAWRDFWKPAYAEVYNAAHEAGLLTFLHSCGYIVDILDDLIEVGLDVIQMDQQENMGLDVLSQRFRGRITFWCPVDIQSVMCNGTPDDIRAYCRRLVQYLGTERGGFMAKWYPDTAGAGHTPEAVAVMCDEFVRISDEMRAGSGQPASRG